MSLTVTADVLKATSHEQLAKDKKSAEVSRVDREVYVDTGKLGAEALQDLAKAAAAVGDRKTVRAVESILAARDGNFGKPVSSFKAFKEVLEAFLAHNHIDGWIYSSGDDGKLYPELVTSVSYDDGHGYGRGSGDPSIKLHVISYGYSRDGNYKVKFGQCTSSYSFSPRDVANRRVVDILADAGLLKETQELRKEYLVTMERHRAVVMQAFAQQFRVTGKVYQFEERHWERKGTDLTGRRVIHDLEARDYAAARREAESFIFEKHGGEGMGVVPEHALVKVFDLKTHEFFWINSDNLTPYTYDKAIGQKMILPASHRDLLDVLTADIGAFVEDFVEGKSAGNVILCKGVPGVGKTLTAEVYAELIEKPLYSIHTGNLGTTCEEIEKNLQVIFQRSKRWGCVLLLDEADVFVVERGSNIEQNAIVAEFLRTLEYFDGLLFMTTNRPNDIDQAILPRCAAVIEYQPPNEKDAAAIWRVMATQFKADLSDDLIGQLLAMFPRIAPRDIKMLLRLALRMATAKDMELDLDTFRTCAMFRAIHMEA